MKQLFKDTVKVSIEDIVPDPNNPNKMTKEQAKSLVYSMKKFDDVMPIVVDSKSMIVADGHHRLEAYKTMGVKEIEVIKKDFKNATERILFGQTMNKLRGEHDKKLDVDVVYALVNGSEENLLEYMRLTAIEDERQVVQYLQKAYPDYTTGTIKKEDEDKLAEIVNFLAHGTEPPITQTGDLYKMGDHYLLCGDCRKPADVRKLLGTNTVDLLLTDPPYGVDYSGKNTFLNSIDKGNCIQTDIEGDNLEGGIEDYEAFFSDFLELVPWSDYNIFYIFMLGFALHKLRAAIDSRRLTWGDYLIWVKNNHVLGRKDYNSKHEFIVYGWKNHHHFFGPFSTTVLEFDKPQVSDLHPVMKPIELLDKLICDGSKPKALVYDPFLGSGSTTIACERNGRQCFGMEIDPRYCDVIVKRWEEFTGNKAERIAVEEVEQQQDA